MLLGPNAGLGHSSMLYMIESQIDHVLAAIAAIDDRDATLWPDWTWRLRRLARRSPADAYRPTSPGSEPVHA